MTRYLLDVDDILNSTFWTDSNISALPPFRAYGANPARQGVVPTPPSDSTNRVLSITGWLTGAQLLSFLNIQGGLSFKGQWNASTNSPALANSAMEPGPVASQSGDYYVVSTSGTTSLDGIAVWGIGDWVVSNGTVWERLNNATYAPIDSPVFTGSPSLSTATATSINGVTFTNYNNLGFTGIRIGNISGGAGASGYISLNGSGAFGSGSVTCAAGSAGAGGNLRLNGGTTAAGGTLDMSDGGGSIYTTGRGSIEFGVSGTRTTLTGAATTNRAIAFPDATGTVALTSQLTLTGVGATTIGAAIAGLTNPGAITFLRANENNTASLLSASDFRTAIGAGTGSGTVQSVAQSFSGGLITASGSPITASGTLALTVAGTSGGIPYFSSGTTWATSAALAANALVIGGGAGAAPRTTTTGMGVLTFLGTPSSANLAVAVTDRTGSGALVFANTPTLITPTLIAPMLGAATATSINGVLMTGSASSQTIGGGAGITMDLSTGTSGINTSNSGGSINTSNSGGSINTSSGGSINTSNSGGSIDTSNSGGSINTTSGGSINTSSGGGAINTTGTGSIEMGVSGTRTTITGTATADRAISFPDASGMLVSRITATATLNFPSVAAGASEDLTISLTGAVDGEVVALGVPNGATNTNGVFSAWVSAADTVTVRFTNTNLVGDIDPSSGDFTVTLIR